MKYFKSADDHQSESLIFMNHSNSLNLFCLLALSLIFWISACDFREVDASSETNAKEENNMESLQSAKTIEYNKPPIDAAIATVTETATFAMG